MRTPAVRGALVCAVAIALAACGGGTPPAPTPTPSPQATLTATRPPAATATSTVTLTPAPPPSPTLPPQPPPPTPSGGAATVVRRGDPGRRVVTLTFDAGADLGFTGQILDTLAANDIVAAFGITGSWAQQFPDATRRIAAEGHTIVNHSYDHASFTGLSTQTAPLSQQQRWYQLDRAESIINDLTGGTTLPYFRPPYGDYDASVNADVFARGYRYNVMWALDSQGWRGRTVDEIVQICLDGAEPGAILIFHVGSASQDANALQRVIDGLRAQGYSFVSLPELVGS
jgi:peptidoglycan/xylan/chitin deacetylase (PgdA/CDA1 family)